MDCANCGRSIGKLETAFNWQGQPVCADCHRRLAGCVSEARAGGGPAMPSYFWLGVGLYILSGLILLGQLLAELAVASDAEFDEPTTAAEGAAACIFLPLILGILALDVVALVMACRGRAWGAIVMIATTAFALVLTPFVATELSGAGAALEAFSTLVGLGSLAVFVLPRSWTYYREHARWRRGRMAQPGSSG